MRRRYYWDKEQQKMVEIRPVKETEAGIYVATDEIPPTESHATHEGKIFTSKKKLFQHYKQHGFECTGGEHLTGRGLADYEPPKPNSREIRETVERSYHDLIWGRVPKPEK